MQNSFASKFTPEYINLCAFPLCTDCSRLLGALITGVMGMVVVELLSSWGVAEATDP